MNENWSRLGAYVLQGRVRAGYPTRTSLARVIAASDGTRVSDRTLGKLETGKSVGEDTLAKVELAIGWKPGSARAVLSGREPTLVTQDAPAESAIDALLRRDPSLREVLDHLPSGLREHVIRQAEEGAVETVRRLALTTHIALRAQSQDNPDMGGHGQLDRRHAQQ